VHEIKWWGAPQHYQSGFYEYGTSPYHLKLFKGFFNPGLSKFVTRIGKKAVIFAPPFLAMVMTLKWSHKEVNLSFINIKSMKDAIVKNF
jgi:hypothetical protein